MLFNESPEASQYFQKEAVSSDSLDDRLLEESQREYLYGSGRKYKPS